VTSRSTSLSPSRRILLLGHRGARLYAPENTIAALDTALHHGADGFEFDIRRTRDGQSVLCHDPEFHRLSVSRHTLHQLQAKCLSAEERIPCLDEVLERFAQNAFLNIEIKVRGAEREIAATLKQFSPQKDCCVSSFLPSVVRNLHQLDGSLPLGIICQTRWQLLRWKVLPVSYVIPHYRLLSRRLVKNLHDAGKTVITWTVNKPRQMLRAAEMGVDGIISDDTKLLVETLRRN